MINARIGETVRVTMPYSEVCMHMRVAGKTLDVRVTECGAQLLNADGSKLSFPITYGEAGIRVIGDPAHADYPHMPGTLYDCAACESDCFCTPDTTECVHCAIAAESV